jgi:hypothetical protein
MARFAGLGFILLLTLAAVAQGSSSDVQSAGAPIGWDAVQHLKPGTKIVVEQLYTRGDYRQQAPCKVIRVDGASLTCRPEDARQQRIIYPADRVLTVYRVHMRVTPGSRARVVLFAAAGFAMGCALTDGNPDYPLGAAVGAAGAAYGASKISKEPKFAVVYWRTEASASAAVSP